MTKNDSRNIPTLGYPTQKAAVLALFKAGMDPNEIAEAVNTSINAVQRTLSDYRRANGIPTPPKKKPTPNAAPGGPADAVWDMEEDKRRDEFARRAARAAREARLAA